jgi:hypothetical protein
MVTELKQSSLVLEVGYIDEDRRRSNAGFLIGWMAAQLLPLPARTERTFF